MFRNLGFLYYFQGVFIEMGHFFKKTNKHKKLLFEQDYNYNPNVTSYLNQIDFDIQQKKLNQFQKIQDAFNELKNICSFSYDAINDNYYFSRQIQDILKIDPDKPFTPNLHQLLQYVHPEDRDLLKNTIQTALYDNFGYQIEYRIVQQDQSIRLIHEQSEILHDEKGNLEGLVGFIQDITERKFYTNVSSIDISNGIESITGYTKNDFNNGLKWVSIVHSEDLPQYLENQLKLEEGNIIQHQYRIVNKQGDIKWVEDNTIPNLDRHGNVIRLEGITSDVTNQKMLQEKNRFLANEDNVTKLPNRNKLIEILDERIEENSYSDDQLAVIKLDIDGFKYINNTVGNELGDELLIQFSNRILKQLTEKDLLARSGGDEFIILIDKVESISSLKMIVHQIRECINEPFNINEFKFFITASLGIGIYSENGTTSLELLRNANLALQHAKKEGKNNYHTLSKSSSIQSYKNYSIGRDIKKAVENREMMLYLQPRVEANSHQIIGAEALIRWNHPEWGLISPHEFISTAEENGLITEIDTWVFTEICQQIKNWKNKGIQVVPISINFSAIHFMKPDWPSKVASIIDKAGILPSDIEFEVTESIILRNTEMVRNSILKLKELGIKIALDDFGKGYSSLSYLTQFPFDVIKIDKTFIQNMHNSNRDLHLIKSIIYMARGLKLRVVAEGVETSQQLKMLQQEQCHEIQGYLFSQPKPIHEFEILLQDNFLPPIEPNQKEAQYKRRNYRISFPYPLEADLRLVSIGDKSTENGVTKVLIENISVDGLKFVSTLSLQVKGDVIYQFETELLGVAVTLKGSIVWKEQVNETLTEYGIQFITNEKEQASFSITLNSFVILLKNSSTLPPYRKVDKDRYQYFNYKHGIEKNL